VNVPERNPNGNRHVLDDILALVREGLPALRMRRGELERAAATALEPPPFLASLRGDRVGLIAEVKRRSPSAGAINPDLDPEELAACYQRGGAVAVSVLTEEAHFGGTLGDLIRVRGVIQLPVLRKDFIVDEVQLIEARAAGASAVLLIVRALPQADLERLLRLASRWELDALVEAHDRAELDRAIDAGAEVVGVNARNLHDFSVDLDGALELVARVPARCVAVAESALSTVADVERAAAAGADAVLIGGALAASPDPESAARALSGVVRRGR
jgi:indole-3-glycerol phosphate synthase